MELETKQTPTTETTVAGRRLTLRVLGIGGGGGNAIDFMAQQAFEGVKFTAVNTDAQALLNLGGVERFTLGVKLTRGLGAGGDPELGRAAAEEDVERLRELCAGADVVCVVAGMGGGTGTGAGPVVARMAKESGALVLGIVTMPFEFEGSRRQRQAQLGLRELKAAADGVICLPNQKVFKLIDENTSVNEALKITNEYLAQGVRGIWRLVTQTGLINVDFNDLCAVLRDRHEESTLATVEAGGDGRSQEILNKLTTHPFLEGGQALAEADAVLVSLAGGPDLTMAEVNRLMEQINRQCEGAHIIMGATIQDTLAGRLSLTLVASREGASLEGARRAGVARDLGTEQNDKELANPSTNRRPASKFVAPAPEAGPDQAQRLLQPGNGRQRKKAAAMRQGQLPLEIVSKGRFEKSEPTIHHGEDLDVPTYIRRGMALN
jgi:cell division protein FtsZ